MDSKRKASTARAGNGADADHPAKRRKSELPDLAEGESPETTTIYGIAFLDTIRRTSDKSGRPVAGHFEQLPPREGNEDYYAKVPMPISLRVIERKILRYALATLTELESWMKRMVMNAKEYYPKNSQIFEDAERVRKATSNWMVKYNPAYKNSASYAATGIAVPSDYDVYAELALEDMAAEEAIGLVVPPVSAMHQQPVQNTMRGRDADREDEDMPDADAEGDAEHDSEVDAEGEEDDEGDEDDAQGEPDVSRGSGPRIVLKRGSARSQQSETTPSVSGEKEDKARYQDVPFDELNFQQAQEKIVDTLLKRTDDEGFLEFQDFVKLPSKTHYKDYYRDIKEPISLQILWRLVRGMQGRGGATGVSHFKSWAAMEQKAELLWKNAWRYNLDDSIISQTAHELKRAFYELFDEAKSKVEEPPQPKIRLRAPSAQAQSTGSAKPKRITIHVGGGREDSQGSPAPGPSGEAVATPNGINGAAARPAAVNPSVANANQDRGALATPGQAVKREDSVRQSPGMPPQISNSYISSAFTVMPQSANGYGQMANGHATAGSPPAPKSAWDQQFRDPSTSLKDAILSNLCVRTQMLDNNPDNRLVFNVPAHPKKLHQSFTIFLNSAQNNVQLIPRISPALELEQRAYKLFVLVNGQQVVRGVPNPRDPVKPGDLLFDALLQLPVNKIEVRLVAARPKDNPTAKGLDHVAESITIMAFKQ